jgi:hypothetical protein
MMGGAWQKIRLFKSNLGVVESVNGPRIKNLLHLVQLL